MFLLDSRNAVIVTTLLTPDAFFSPTSSDSVPPAGCPTIQLTSDTTYLGTRLGPMGSVPQNCSPTPTSEATCAPDQPAISRKFLWNPPSICLLEQQENSLLTIPRVLSKNVIKESDEHADGRATRDEDVGRRRATTPCLAPARVYQPGSSPNPRLWGFLWRLLRGGVISH